jgi:hypothetical protein
MRPGEGPELLLDDGDDTADVELVDDCEASELVALGVVDSVVGAGPVLPALDAVVLASAAGVVRVGAPGRLGMAVGMTMDKLCADKKDAATLPTLDRMLLICLRCWRYLR